MTVDLSKLPLKHQIRCVLVVEKEALTRPNIYIKASVAAFQMACLYPAPNRGVVK